MYILTRRKCILEMGLKEIYIANILLDILWHQHQITCIHLHLFLPQNYIRTIYLYVTN